MKLIDRLLKILILLILFFPIKSFACTSFFIEANDTMLFGNTMDIDVGDAYVFINKRNVAKTGLWWPDAPTWNSKYASITTNMWGREFPARGMNEAGLVLGEMNLTQTIYPYPDDRHRMELVQWMQYILDNCATIQDVVAYNQLVRIDQEQYKSHFLFSDANGNSMVVEWINGEMMTYTSDELPVAVLTNSKYPVLLDHYNNSSPPNNFEVSSLARFYKAASMIELYNSETEGSIIDYAFKILNKVENPGFTKWKLLFDITNKRLYFNTYNCANRRYIDLDYFDLMCLTPAKMINLYDTLEGNINDSLIDFDYEINKSHLESYASKGGYGSPSWLSAYYDYPDLTECLGPVYIINENYQKNQSVIKSIIVDNEIHLTLNPDISGDITIELINIYGSLIYSERKMVSPKEVIYINCSNKSLSKGIYFIRCKTETTEETRKFIIY